MPERLTSASARDRSDAGPDRLGPDWRTSSYSQGTPECVQVALRSGVALVRDSKNPDTTVLELSPREWVALLADVSDTELSD
jgi:hypothetical protein